jgi:beta-propeller repeat-containing protein
MRATRLARAWSGVLCCFWLSFCLFPSRTLAVSPTGSLRETGIPRPPVPPPSVFHNLPLQFEENAGQADKETRFLARGVGYTLLLQRDGLRLALRHVRPISMRWAGANTGTISGREPTPTVTNYYLGSNPAGWHLNVRSYRSVVCSEVYKGIDLLYHGSGQQLEYDFVVAPQADPAQIRMRFEGLQPILIGEDLALEGVDSLRIKELNAYQWIHGSKKVVEASWRVHAGEASIQLGTYDHSRELIIDPIFFYGTYIGGNGADDAVSVVKGAQQDQYYVAMSTSSAELEQPATHPNVSNPNCSGGTCGINTLLLEIQATTTDIPIWGKDSPQTTDLASTAVVYPTVLSATYFGGNTGATKPASMVADGNFNLYVSGSTTNPNGLPPLGTKICSLNCTGYVAKLSSSLTLIYSLALAAVGDGIAVDGTGDVYITGMAAAGSLTTPPGDLAFQQLVTSGSALTSGTHAYLLELGPTGALLFSSFIGGSGTDQGKAIAVSAGTNPMVYVTGQTSSTDFPTKCTACQTAYGGGSGDAFALATSNLASSPVLEYSTYLGGSGDDSASSIAVDSAGNAVLVGSTASTDFPNIPPSATVRPIFQFTRLDDSGNLTTPVMLPSSVPPGSQDGFVTSLSADGTLRFTDFLGGNDSTASITSANAVVLDRLGVIYVTGTSNATIETSPASPTDSSTDFMESSPPSISPPNIDGLGGAATTDNWAKVTFDTSNLTNNHVFFAQIDPIGQNLLQATIGGGLGDDQGKSLSVAGYCFSSEPPKPPPTDPPTPDPVYPPCVGTASIVGSTDDASQDKGLFGAASTTTLYPVDPPSPSGSNAGFFVQEELAGYCNMQFQQQLESSLTLGGDCVSGTSSGMVYVTDSSKPSKIVKTASITINDAFHLTPSASLSLNLSGVGGVQPYTLTFSFLPLGAIGAVGSCTLTGGSGGFPSGCPITQTGGGGAGTIFDVTSGALSVVLSCPGPECQYNNTPNTVVVGQPVTLNAVVTNGIPKTVFWSSSGGTFGSDISTPSTSITFTPGGSGGPVVVRAIPVVDLSLTPVPSITLSTVNLGGNGGPLSITSPPNQLVAGTTFQFKATSELVTWTASAGTIDSSTGDFTAPNPPPAHAQITITATSTANAQIATTQVTIVPVPALVVPASITVPVGGKASTPISITAGTGIAGESMALACSPATLPSGVSCFFTPNPVVNAAGAMTTLQIVSNTVSFNFPNRDSPWKKYPFDDAAIVVAGCIFIFGRRRHDRRIMMVLTTTLAATALLSLAACGTGGTFNPTTQPSHVGAGTYTINITVSGASPGAADYNEPLTTVPIKVTLQ